VTAIPPKTRVLTVRGQSYVISRFAVAVVDGPDRGARAIASSDELTVGAERGVDLQLTDPSVSRHHCAIRATTRGLEVRDLGSTNGTMLQGCEIVRAYVTGGTQLRIGTTVIAVEILVDEITEPMATDHRCFDLAGASDAMRRLYPRLLRYAESDGTVLITGETGTGKELAADAIHRASRRSKGPFVAINCGALSSQLTESELFGHVRGAFTGAEADRRGAFEQAHGGTLFLDEVGELPPSVQPLLLRVLESRTIRPLGASGERKVDVRVIAATHRDLRAAVNRRQFRADLYFRLHVLPVELPPLREREGDVALLAELFWRELRESPPPAELLAGLARQSWPGNVRELRNAVERAVLVGWSETNPGETDWCYADARQATLAAWERAWVTTLVAHHGGNLSAAARAAGMARTYLRRLVQRHNITTGSDES
jgi:transcriptional regulator with GAF, ATPase, and Fis domain